MAPLPKDALSEAVADAISGKPKMFHRVYLAAYGTMLIDPWAMLQAVTNGVKLGAERNQISRQTCLERAVCLVKPLQLAEDALKPCGSRGAPPMLLRLQEIVVNTVA